MSCTILWRTTSRPVRCTNARPSMPLSTRARSSIPLREPARSIWVMSAVTTTREPNPIRVRNIFICSGVVFWASSRMMKLSLSVPPRRAQDLGREDLRRAFVGLHHVDRAGHVHRVERVALLEQQHQLLEQPADAVGVGAVDGDLVAPHERLGVEGRLDQPQQLVALTQQAHHVVLAGDEDLDLGGGHVSGPAYPLGYGGQPIGLPPSTCRCRCGIELSASGPTLNTRRYPRSATPSWRATRCAVVI